jgi:hypothetical protein
MAAPQTPALEGLGMEILIWIDAVTPLLQNRATEEALMGKTRSNNPVEPGSHPPTQ